MPNMPNCSTQFILYATLDLGRTIVLDYLDDDEYDGEQNAKYNDKYDELINYHDEYRRIPR